MLRQLLPDGTTTGEQHDETATVAVTDGGEQSTESDEAHVLLETKPNLTPAFIRFGLTFLIGLAILLYLFRNPDLLGSAERTNVALVVGQIILAVALVRIIADIIILRSTTYILTDRTVRREYALVFREKSTEVPYDLVRSTERSQGRIESLLDVGSVSLNRGLGDLRLSYLSDHDNVYQTIREQVENA